MKILNLYAGIGGNRKLWGDTHQVTAVEFDPKIAAKYKEFFPNDTVVVADAHQYLLDHYSEFDLIWTSPPCQTHTRMNIANQLSPYKDNTRQLTQGGGIVPRDPKMELYQEIIFLQHFLKGFYVVENVVSYYKPLIEPIKLNGHYFWANFPISHMESVGRGMGKGSTSRTLAQHKGFDWDSLNGLDKELVLRNCVEPIVAKHIIDNLEQHIK